MDRLNLMIGIKDYRFIGYIIRILLIIYFLVENENFF